MARRALQKLPIAGCGGGTAAGVPPVLCGAERGGVGWCSADGVQERQGERWRRQAEAAAPPTCLASRCKRAEPSRALVAAASGTTTATLRELHCGSRGMSVLDLIVKLCN